MRRAENSQLVWERSGILTHPQLRSTRTCCACTAASLQELEELGLLPRLPLCTPELQDSRSSKVYRPAAAEALGRGRPGGE